ncbi:ubiquitin-conjugating enzyme [Tyrophagus putrescentiae]|nr:ubiquitin-conjugating enzyme [Tyrophagus putrescentiae]
MGDNQLVLATKRIQRDLLAFNLYSTAQTMYSIELVSEENMFQLKGHINGPPDTPYYVGIFV